ncbi:response regulator [Oricola cellulosilytica]|uniref:Response regulator n=1 Tax=Oricola cellulosilytica TaxID=1429082 RepID=A0A4R0PF65_9HYPH|nr:response regulator [Oricola cellulosilytica]TCD14124.1 response regulator [Oricola cellulosilytica]
MMAAVAKERFPGGRIMVVDDNAFDRSLIIGKMRAAMKDCHLIEIGESASAAPAVAESRPDLVLLDIRMPAPDGFAVLSRIRKLRDGGETKVVMLSSSTSPRDQRRAKELGADGYEVKPDSLAGYDRMIEDIAAKWLTRH